MTVSTEGQLLSKTTIKTNTTSTCQNSAPGALHTDINIYQNTTRGKIEQLKQSMERISRLIRVEHEEQPRSANKATDSEEGETGNGQSRWKPSSDVLQDAVESRVNPGESMYLRGLKQQQRRTERLDQLRRQRNEELVQSCTFRPNINRAARAEQTGPKVAIEDRLILFNRDKKDKVARMKNIVEELANLECTFQPTINQ